MKKLLTLMFACFILPSFAYETDTVSRDHKMQQKVSEVGFKLLNSSRVDKIIPIYYDPQDRTVNAYTTVKRKTVRIPKGIMRFVDNDDELAALIGHEIAHAIELHRNPYFYIPMWLDSKAYEFEADKKGVDLMVNAGYNPLAMLVLDAKFMHQANFDWVPVFHTHPKTSRRLAAVYEYIYMKYPQYLANNEYKDNIYYQNFLLTSKDNRKRFEAKAKNPSRKVKYK